MLPSMMLFKNYNTVLFVVVKMKDFDNTCKFDFINIKMFCPELVQPPRTKIEFSHKLEDWFCGSGCPVLHIYTGKSLMFYLNSGKKNCYIIYTPCMTF